MKNRNSEINTILAIDTSCDDTSVAVTEKNKILVNEVSSQMDLHKKWGGVVPGIAKREHQQRIDFVIEEALKNSNKTWEDIDAIAVTQGPGLAVALEVGVAKAKELAIKYKKPLIPVDHMEGHLLSSLADIDFDENDIFPALGVLVSGAHTELIQANRVEEYKILGQTLDDALGEAFDKVARLLGLDYPGGAKIEQLAKQGDPDKYDLPIAMKNSDSLDLSYSGIKTAVLYLVRDLSGQSRVQQKSNDKGKTWLPGAEPPKDQNRLDEDRIDLTEEQIADICASFQKVAVKTLTLKISKALKQGNYKSILLGGGVVHNQFLKSEIQKIADENGVRLMVPNSSKLFMDNAAMIANVAYLGRNSSKILRSKDDITSLDRNPSLVISG